MNSSENPELSVIVIIVSDSTSLRGNASQLDACLESLFNQVDAPSMEVLVPFFMNVDGVENLQQRFPGVKFIPASTDESAAQIGNSREHHDELKTLGLLEAKGRIVGFLEDNERPDEFWSKRTMEAHQDSYVGVGGAIENGIDRVLNWSIYFCDFLQYQNPISYGETTSASDANISYKRSALDSVKASWENGFNEITVNAALMDGGGKLALSPHIVVHQHRGSLKLGSVLHERFIWGRSFGAVRCKVIGLPQRLVLAVISPILPIVVTLKLILIAVRKRRNFGKFIKALPIIPALLISWGLGEMMGYITAKGD